MVFWTCNLCSKVITESHEVIPHATACAQRVADEQEAIRHQREEYDRQVKFWRDTLKKLQALSSAPRIMNLTEPD